MARYETIKTLLAASVEEKMHIHYMDVVMAYVQGSHRKGIHGATSLFIRKGKETKICELRKPLYGLKQADKVWYIRLNNFLLSIGMYKTDVNLCVYINSTKRNSDNYYLYR